MTKELLDYFKGDELAANVWLDKYAQEGEITPDDMHKRLAKEFARIEEDYSRKNPEGLTITEYKNLSKYGNERKFLSEERIYNYFKDFKYIIPQGSIMSQLGAKSVGSLSNCFVVGQPSDSYGGIMMKDEEMVQLMKRRGGVGIDISTLRPEGTHTSNAAKSSTGAVSFMHRFSNTTREVAQAGRRGALMISIDINHPDVMNFIKIKRDLTQVTGANISIKLNDEFMRAVEADDDYILRFPCDRLVLRGVEKHLEFNVLQKFTELSEVVSIGENKEPKEAYFKKIKAKEYWDEIIKSAHNVAEPGLMFWDSMVNYSPDGAYPQFRQVTTNPCSEIGMQPYDACRLIVVNLFSFVKNPYTKDAYFDVEEFYKVNYEAMRLSDDLIDLEIEHIDRIINKIHLDPEDLETKYRELRLWNKVRETASASRRTGLGFTALADTLAGLNLGYDSDDALKVIKTIMSVKLESELDCTTDLAILRGTFTGWDPETEFTEDSAELHGNNDFYQFLVAKFFEQAKRMNKFGRRNVSWSTVAPTGTVSLMTQTTSGIEPLFMPFYTRRKKINPGETGVRVDFIDQNGDSWQEFAVLHPKFKDWARITKWLTSEEIESFSKEDLQKLFEDSPWYNSTANDINWVRRVEIQGLIQQYITHSISSTINLPNDVKEEEVSQIYLESWKKGLKGITVYRDGSRSGVLVSSKEEKRDTRFNYQDAPKRPKELDAEMHVVSAKGSKFTIIVGLLDGKAYEIFGYSYAPEDGKPRKGKVVKEKKGLYNFVSEGKVEHISHEMSDEQGAITRLISTSLRHGADIKFVVEQLLKCEGDLFSFTKALSRVLKKYIPEGAKSTMKCHDCGSSNVVFEEGCSSCKDCGSSKCG